MTDFLYQYPPLKAGILRKRYKRFLADVELENGEVVTAHCPNTGPMTGVCQVGQPVQLSVSNNPKRKHPYTWEMIQMEDPDPVWVGINTSVPNRVVKVGLENSWFGELSGYDNLQSEVKYGENSRVDFLLTSASKPPIYVEVKNTTWCQGNVALFPDTETKRGQKHLQELMALLPEARVVMLYFINRSDCTQFTSGDQADSKYGELLRSAVDKGLEVLPCRFDVSPEGIRYLGLANYQYTVSSS